MIEKRPHETIVAIQQENRTMRWLVLILCLTIISLAGALVKKPAPVVWFVHERGDMVKSDGTIFSWGPVMAVQHAFESMFVPSENRAAIVEAFFSGRERSPALGNNANDRFVFFRVEKPVSVENGRVAVEGTLFRDGKDSTRMRVLLERVAPSDLNPFGLMVSSVEVVKS
jgi:hypothetical protein